MSEEILTENDFRFSKIKLYTKTPQINRDQLLVRVVKSDPVYKSLSAQYHRAYIEHNIPEIPNSCPTIEQYWEELKVYRCELDDETVYPVKNRKPKAEFFIDANTNFASQRNSRNHKFTGSLVPIYYYHYNTETKSPEYISIQEAKKYYCKAYEKDIMENDESKSTFMLLLTLCKCRNKKYPVIIRGFKASDILDEPADLKDIYEDPKKDFPAEYCLAEMLIHYPNLNECIWNK